MRFFSLGRYTPSAVHHYAQRASAFAAIIATPFNNFSPAAQIPTKFIQSAISLYTFLRQDTDNSEKIQQALLALIAGTQLGLSITLLFQGRSCPNDNLDAAEGICKGVFLLDLLYTATLSLGWGRSEITAYLHKAANTPIDPQMPPVQNTDPLEVSTDNPDGPAPLTVNQAP